MRVSAWTKALRFWSGKYGTVLITADPEAWSAGGVGRFTNVALTVSNRRTVSWAFAPSRSVFVPSTASTRSHQYRVTFALWVIIPVHQSCPGGRLAWPLVSWAHWCPPKRSCGVRTASNVVFRMSKSAVAALPSSDRSWRLVMPEKVASPRFDFNAVLMYRDVPG